MRVDPVSGGERLGAMQIRERSSRARSRLIQERGGRTTPARQNEFGVIGPTLRRPCPPECSNLSAVWRASFFPATKIKSPKSDVKIRISTFPPLAGFSPGGRPRRSTPGRFTMSGREYSTRPQQPVDQGKVTSTGDPRSSPPPRLIDTTTQASLDNVPRSAGCYCPSPAVSELPNSRSRDSTRSRLLILVQASRAA